MIFIKMGKLFTGGSLSTGTGLYLLGVGVTLQNKLGKLETGIGSNRGFDGSPTLVLPTETFDKEFINQKLWWN